MKKVLLVEDDKFLSKVYQMKMQKVHIDSLSLHDGVAVFETAKKEKPGVIILDLVMPNKDGFEVLKELKSNSETKDIPVVVLSALESDEDVKKVKALGAEKYIAKSTVSLSYIVDLIGGYLK